jgi:exopolysaccharide biosynthesis polyprenyl glycosylphosphotransferase
MKRVREDTQVLVLYFLTDVMLYWLALAVATLARLDALGQVDFLRLERDRLIGLVVFCASNIISGVYRRSRVSDRFDAVYYGLIALCWAGIVQLVLSSAIPASVRVITRRELIIALAVAAILLSLWRYFAARFVNRFTSLHRFFYVLGSRNHGERIVEEILRQRSGVRAEARYLSLEDLEKEIERREREAGPGGVRTEEAIITLESKDHGKLDELLLFCNEHFRRTFLYPSLHDVLLFQHQHLLAVAGIPLIEVASRQVATPYLYLKRLIDIVASALGLLLSLPICLAAAIAIKAGSDGPILYSQERLGKGGRPFRIFKFRSMRSDVELKDETGHVLAQENDPRITPVGQILRRHRIDEIPQLFNVLKGDMSLIGPRPAWREFYEANGRSTPLLEQRLAVRPGLTCLSHVLGSYTSEPEDRLSYDLVYISSLSFMTDLRILIGTVRIVLSGKGAR